MSFDGREATVMHPLTGVPKTMKQRTPAVITGPELAAILTKLANHLRTWPETEVIQVRHDSKQGIAPPSLSVVIEFDPAGVNWLRFAR